MAEKTPPEPQPWPVVSTEIVAETRIFRLRSDMAKSPRTGQVHPFQILESPDWVNIVAVTPDREMVFIRQYRFGTGEVTLEIPGGLIDPGEDPRSAALRELREETGFVPGAGDDSDRVRRIGRIRPNPAFMTNTCYTYLVEEAVSSGGQNLDPAEDISVELIKVGDIPEMIRSGQIDHGIVLNALHWWELDRG